MVTPYFKKIFLHKAYNYTPHSEIPTHWQDITVEASGKGLRCLVWNHEEPKGLVILAHPYQEKGKDFFIESGHAHLYHTWGFQVVVFDFNGFGESRDRDFNFKEDLLIISNHFNTLYQPKKIIAHGISFGAAIVLTALQDDHLFDKAIVENCLDEVSNYFRVRNKNLYRTIVFSQFLISRLKRQNRYYKAAEKIKNLDDLLLLYSEDDDLTTPEMGIKIKQHCAVTCHYKVLKGRHMESINSDNKKYKETIRDYLSWSERP